MVGSPAVQADPGVWSAPTLRRAPPASLGSADSLERFSDHPSRGSRTTSDSAVLDVIHSKVALSAGLMASFETVSI
jgi:hypothetical protein